MAIKQLKTLWASVALALAVGGCAAPAVEAKPRAPRPALWKVSDADTTIYLFGTIHLLPEGQGWRSPALEKALAGSDELVLEIANIDDQMASAQAMAKLGMSPNLPPFRERVPEAKRATLDAMIAESGLPAAVFDRLETWAGALPLLGVTFKRLGLDPSSGVETTLTEGWKKSGKPVRGLETIEEQLGFFDTMPEAEQRAFLEGVLEPSGAAAKQFAAMLDAWAKGDEAALNRAFADEQNLTPALRQVLLTRRNARWADWLDKRMDQPGTVFVAVGAGHLAGPDKVQAFLKKHGHKAKRVQ
ncbi:MAG TPA: TraB/GumN family protein [Allosphingosinicella sp.]